MESEYDAKNDDTFGSDFPKDDFSLASLSLQTKGFSGANNESSNIPDTIFSAFDAIGSSLDDLMQDNPTADDGKSDEPKSESTAGLWNDGLVAPDQFMKTETTSIGGKSIGSIWGLPQAQAPPANPQTTTANTGTSTASAAAMSVADLEAKLTAKKIAVPKAPAGARPPPGLSMPASAVSGQPQKEKQQQSEQRSRPQSPATAGDTAKNGEKETPILNQLQHAQGQRVIQQKLMSERTKVDAKLRDINVALHQARMQLQLLHNERMHMSKSQPQSDQDRSAINQRMNANFAAIKEVERQCNILPGQQMQIQHEFELFQVQLAIEGDTVEQHRSMLAERVRQIESTIKSHSEGITGLQRHMAQLQQAYGKMTAPNSDQATPTDQINNVRGQIDFVGRNLQSATMQQQQFDMQLRHTKELINALPSQDNDDDAANYNNLMSESEKQWLIKIQSKQMYSDNPYVDDFYAHALIRKRAGQMRMAAAQNGLAPPQIHTPHVPAPRTKQRDPAHTKPEYTPVGLDGTLGQIKSTSIRAPQQLIKMPTMSDDNDLKIEDDPNLSREYQERAWKRKILLAIEEGYRYLLMIEDRFVKLEPHTLPKKVRIGVEKDVKRIMNLLFDLFGIKALSKEWEPGDDQQFRQFMTVTKGKALIARFMRFATPEQTHAILLVALRTITTLLTARQGVSEKEHAKHLEELSMILVPSLLGRIESIDLGTVISCLKTASTFYVNAEENKKSTMHEPMSIAILYAIFRRADALLGQPSTTQEQQAQWCALVEAFVEGTVAVLGKKVKSTKGTPQHLWEYANIVAAHSGPTGRAAIRSEMAALVPESQAPPFMTLLLQITKPPENSG